MQTQHPRSSSGGGGSMSQGGALSSMRANTSTSSSHRGHHSSGGGQQSTSDSSATNQQSQQQSILIPVVTFSSIVPVTDVVGDLPAAHEIGPTQNLLEPKIPKAMEQCCGDLREREKLVSASGRDPASENLASVTIQLANALQQLNTGNPDNNLSEQLYSAITPNFKQETCSTADFISESLNKILAQQSGKHDPKLTDAPDTEQLDQSRGSSEMVAADLDNHHHFTSSGRKNDESSSCDISHAINPELALPTKHNNSPNNNMTSSSQSPNRAVPSFANSSAALHSPAGMAGFERTKMKKDEDCNSPMKLLGNMGGVGDAPSLASTRNCLVNLGPKLESDSLLSSPGALSGKGGPVTAAALMSPLSKETNMKPLVVKLTPLDDEAAEKALRGKKLDEITFSKSHREERGLFDYLTAQFIPTSSKRYSTFKNEKGGGRKRKRSDDSTGDDNDELFAPDGEEGSQGLTSKSGGSSGAAVKVVEPVWKKRKYNRVHSLLDQQMNKKEIKDSSEYKRCAQLLDNVLESVDEGYLVNCVKVNGGKSSSSSSKKKKKRNDSWAEDEDEDGATGEHNSFESSSAAAAVDDDHEDRITCPPELQVKRAILSELTTECSKLKAAEIMNVVPVEKLTKLLSVLEHNIRDGTKLALASGKYACQTQPGCNSGGERNRDAWREMVLERIWRAAEASLLALTILTAPSMPKRVYMEELFETLIEFVRFQFHNSMYPEFDPVYRISKEDKEKGSELSMKIKRAKVAMVKEKNVLGLYNRFCEIAILLADLFAMQVMTDGILLSVCKLTVSVFFVENISELQLAVLRLITTVFSRYPQHRNNIFQEFFSSLSRLPCSKRSLRPFRLAEDEHIQMVTALILQLIQSVIILPSQSELETLINQSATAALAEGSNEVARKNRKDAAADMCLDIDSLLTECSEQALRISQTFLNLFLTKCTTKGEEDFRPVFENFVQDLLTTVNKPEWPAAEVALSLLGRLLNHHFCAKGSDTAMRVACLDYLGVIAARLRKDAATSKCSRSDIEAILEGLKAESASAMLVNFEDDDCNDSVKESFSQQLQRVILDYLQDLSDTEPSLLFAKGYYIAQWYKDMCMEIDRSSKLLDCSSTNNNMNPSVIQQQQQQQPQASNHVKLSPAELMAKVKEAEKQKSFLLSLIHAKPGSGIASMRHAHLNLSYENACLIASYLASERPFMKSFDVYLRQIISVLAEPSVAIRTKAVKCLTAVVEADPTLLSRIELQQSVKNMFLDASSNVREAAVDLLSRFVLLRDDLPEKYYGMIANRILDTGVSVRKRVVRILRDICIEKPDFPHNSEICCKLIRRINDEETIRKLVLDVFQKLWFTPLSTTVDSSTAFQHQAQNRVYCLQLQNKIDQIIETIRHSTDTGLDGFQCLLSILVKDENTSSNSIKALTEIVDGVIEYMVNLEETQDSAHPSDESQGLKSESNDGILTTMTAEGSNQITSKGEVQSAKLMACLSVLHLIAKIRPTLLVPHASALQPYLAIKVQSASDSMILFYTAAILEITVPLICNPGESLLTSLQTELTKVIMNGGINALNKCVGCLTTIVLKMTKNYQMLNECIDNFYKLLTSIRHHQEEDDKLNIGKNWIGLAKGRINRALYTLGLLCQQYNPLEYSTAGFTLPLQQLLSSPAYLSNSTHSTMDDRLSSSSHSQNNNNSVDKSKFVEFILDVLLYYALCGDTDVKSKALTGLGFICSSYPELMLADRVKSLYFDALQSHPLQVSNFNSPSAANSSCGPYEMRELVLRNLENFLLAEDARLLEADEDFRRARANDTSGGEGLVEHLKELGDLNSGMASSVIQVYYSALVQNFFTPSAAIRLQALKVVCLVLKQGLIQPVSCVPYLIALSSDNDSSNRDKSQQQLTEIDSKYPGFISQKASQGLSYAFHLHKNLRPTYEVLRGYRIDYDPAAALGGPSHGSGSGNASGQGSNSGGGTNQTCHHIEAFCSSVYSLIRGNRNTRRSIVKPLLAMFDSCQQNFSLRELLFFADNLAAFPYQMQDEVFFIIHTVDIQLSITGAHILAEFKNVFYPERKQFMSANDQPLEYGTHITNHTSLNSLQQQSPNVTINSNPSMMANNVNNSNKADASSSLYSMNHQLHQQHPSGMMSNGVCDVYPQQDGQMLTSNPLGDTREQTQKLLMLSGQNAAHLQNNSSSLSGYLQHGNQMNEHSFGNMGSLHPNLHQHHPSHQLQVPPNIGIQNMHNASLNSGYHLNSMGPGNIMQEQNVNNQILQFEQCRNVIMQNPSHTSFNQQQMNPVVNIDSPCPPQMEPPPLIPTVNIIGGQHQQQQQQMQLPPDDDFEDENSLYARYPDADGMLVDLVRQSLGCILLCLLKQHLKTVYSITDSKYQNYSPNEPAKVYEKPLSRKSGMKFEPTVVINYIQFGGYQTPVVDPQQRSAIIHHYLEFKELMMQLDGCDEDENGEVIARPFYYLNKPSLSNKYQASASINPDPRHQSGTAAINHNRSNTDDAGDNEQQILKNASFIERMQKKTKRGRKSKKGTSTTPAKKRGRKRVVIHSDSEEESPDDAESDPDFA